MLYVMLIVSWLGLSTAQAQVLEKPPCVVAGIPVGYIHGQNEALIDSLVSKEPLEQLTPLARPNPLKPLPNEYINPRLQTYYKNTARSEVLQEDAAIHAMTMIRKAYEEGIRIWVHSGYRSYEQQCTVFRSKVMSEIKDKNLNPKEAINLVNRRSAFPGESEHQLGTTMDLVSDDHQLEYGLKFEFARTKAYQWLQENAAEYGFVLSFPLNPNGINGDPHPKTKIIFEPWHWRYIGKKWAYQYKTCQDKMTNQEFLRLVKKDPDYICRF